ncbi:hypothetical protein ERO13_A01G129201v2 [Gossypium hirsutum]|nr:hypothetical protein ERO13_A01G129201v2 [Gossypium hirsutum]
MRFKSRSRKRKDCGLNCKIFIFWYQVLNKLARESGRVEGPITLSKGLSSG